MNKLFLIALLLVCLTARRHHKLNHKQDEPVEGATGEEQVAEPTNGEESNGGANGGEESGKGNSQDEGNGEGEGNGQDGGNAEGEESGDWDGGQWEEEDTDNGKTQEDEETPMSRCVHQNCQDQGFACFFDDDCKVVIENCAGSLGADPTFDQINECVGQNELASAFVDCVQTNCGSLEQLMRLFSKH